MLIATITAAGPDGIVRESSAAFHDADVMELRLDRCSMAALQDLGQVVPRIARPVLVTCRRASDGGSFQGSEDERGALLRRGVEAGAAWVDLEWRSGVEHLASELGPARVILSHHDWECTPLDLEALYAGMAAVSGVSMVKLVGRAQRVEDNLRIRRLLSRVAGLKDVAAFCSGPAGTASRILALSWGAAATFASAGSVPAAPGQLPVGEMAQSYRVRELSSDTIKVGVVGAPLGHSLSPRVHNAGYRHLDLDFVYLPLESTRIGQLETMARELPLRGFSVTLPHKETIRGLLRWTEPLAERVGAVNTVLCDPAGWAGLNTDMTGGLEPLRRRISLQGREVTLLGAGGAARALAHALAAEGAHVTIFNRGLERAVELAGEIGGRACPWESLGTHRADVLVNATSVGMAPAVDESPIPPERLRAGLVYDIVYNPRETALLRAARSRGIEIVEGLEMFLAQAAEQFRLFTGREPPMAVMRRAALDALQRQDRAASPTGGVDG